MPLRQSSVPATPGTFRPVTRGESARVSWSLWRSNGGSLFRAWGPADEQCEASPTPDAVDLDQTGLTHPQKLALDVRQSVFGIIGRPTDGGQELGVQLGRRRGHHFEVGEEATRLELMSNLGEESPFPVISEVMDRKARNDDVESAEAADRVDQVPLVYRHPLVWV
jgi:hypothetical protein